MATDNKKRIITISREYGAGGRTIAKGLSEKLGIPWYDRDFVKYTAKLSGYSEEDIFEEGEELKESAHFLDKILNGMVSYTSSHDAIYQAQKEAIYELAKEPCILVGRCANKILKEADIPSFDIFLHADKSVRIKRCIEKAQGTIRDMKKYVEKKDELRENYYHTYTGGKLNMAHDYTICLDTGVFDYDTCIDILAKMISEIS